MHGSTAARKRSPKSDLASAHQKANGVPGMCRDFAVALQKLNSLHLWVGDGIATPALGATPRG